MVHLAKFEPPCHFWGWLLIRLNSYKPWIVQIERQLLVLLLHLLQVIVDVNVQPFLGFVGSIWTNNHFKIQGLN